MALYLTYVTYDCDDVQVMTHPEFAAQLPGTLDWAEYVWQEADSPEQAVA